MFSLGLLICVVLRAFSAQAMVLSTFHEISGFFYKNTEPGGMDRNGKKICQKFQYGRCHYATLYSVAHRIPLYSAYRLDQDCLKSHSWGTDGGSTAIWYIEPQLSGVGQLDYMIPESNPYVSNKMREDQAVSSDFRESRYDLGLMNPDIFQCSEGRTAVFTLTNTAPVDSRFNHIHWSKWERTLRSFLLHKINIDGDSVDVFIVSGTVPSANVQIGNLGKVTVPSHIWTAVCYKHQSNDRKSFSFGFIGENLKEGGVRLMSVSDLNTQLSHLYSKLTGAPQDIQVFTDDCFADSDKLNAVQVEFSKSFNLLEQQNFQLSPELQKIIDTMRWVARHYSTSDKTNVKVKKVATELAFNSMDAYTTVTEGLKEFADSTCLLTRVKLAEVTDPVECLLVSQKTATDGSLCTSVSQTGSSCLCFIGQTTKPCCSSPCVYQDRLQGYRCHSGQQLIQCSSPYSLITVSGERCKDEHPCGTYGHSYYWCYKAAGSWDYCSPPLWRSKTTNGQYCRSDRACAKYGEDYQWCYDSEGLKTKCCTSDSCYTTVSGTSCRSDHPCGYYAHTYLWCYTKGGDWDYCCKACN